MASSIFITNCLRTDAVSGGGEQSQRLLEPVGLGKNIVCIEGGNHKYTDSVVGKDGGYLRDDSNQGEIQNSLDLEGLPAITPFNDIGGDESSRANQGLLLIGRTGEYERLIDFDLRVILQLADGKLFTQNI